MKQCPNCGADAQDGWILCPSCGIDMRKAAERLGRDHYISPGSEPVFNNQVPLPQQKTVIQQTFTQPLSHSVSVEAYSSNVLLILLLVAFVPAIFFQPLPWVVVILSAIAVYVDAGNLRAGNGQKETFGSLTWSPFSWAALVILMWIIGLPLYLYRRREIWEQSMVLQ